MASVNKVILVGNVGNNPEIRRFENGGMIANISIATNERWNDRNTGELREQTEWHRVVFNNRLAEIVEQYVRRGSSLYIEGSLRTRKWQDQNGQDRYSTEIRAESMQLLGSRNNNDNSYQNNSNASNRSNHQNGQQASSRGNNYQNTQYSGNQDRGPVSSNAVRSAPTATQDTRQAIPSPDSNQFQPKTSPAGSPTDDDMPF